jgi:hypothetical protein
MGSSQYEKSWKRSAFKERNDKIRRLRAEGMELTILCKRFDISWTQLTKILKEREDG